MYGTMFIIPLYLYLAVKKMIHCVQNYILKTQNQ